MPFFLGFIFVFKFNEICLLAVKELMEISIRSRVVRLKSWENFKVVGKRVFYYSQTLLSIVAIFDKI
jgi:hypothetical protein